MFQENLRQFVDRIFTVITKSGVSCPTVMCDIFFSLRESAAKRFQGELLYVTSCMLNHFEVYKFYYLPVYIIRVTGVEVKSIFQIRSYLWSVYLYCVYLSSSLKFVLLYSESDMIEMALRGFKFMYRWFQIKYAQFTSIEIFFLTQLACKLIIKSQVFSTQALACNKNQIINYWHLCKAIAFSGFA